MKARHINHYPMKKLACIILLLSVHVMLFSCAPKKPTASFTGTIPPPENILREITRAGTIDKVVTATARISINTPEGKYSRTVAVVARRPSFLRIEAIPIFGTPDFFLSVNKKTLKVFLPKEGNFYIGYASRKNLFSFFQIYLDADEIVSILTGTPPAIGSNNYILKGSLEGKLYRIDILSEGKRIQSLWIEPKHHVMTRIEVLNEDGGTGFSATFEDYHSVENTSFPKKVKIIIEKPEKIYTSIRYSNIQISSKQEKGLFDLFIPAGITPVFIE